MYLPLPFYPAATVDYNVTLLRRLAKLGGVSDVIEKLLHFVLNLLAVAELRISVAEILPLPPWLPN